MGELIAVQGLGDAQVSGAIVFWRLSGAVDFEDLEAAWHAAGLDTGLLPAPVSRFTALKRTMETFREPGVLVRPLRTEAEGFVLVREAYADGRPHYTNTMEVTLTEAGLALDPFDAEVARQLGATYARHLNTLSLQDVSGWLVDLVRGVAAVRLRDTGGIYFVPRDRLDDWRRYVATIRACSASRMFEVPALQSDEAVAAVLDALTREAEEAAEAMAEALAGGVVLGTRSKNAKLAAVKALEVKVGGYEALLGVKLDALHAQFEALQARIAVAALAADGAEG